MLFYHILGSIPSTPPTTGPKPFYGQQNRSPVPYSPQAEPSKPTNNAFWGTQNQKPAEPEEPPQQSKFQLKKDNSFQNRFAPQDKTPAAPEAPRNRYGATPGIVNKAKEGLTGSSYLRPEQKSPIVCH